MKILIWAVSISVLGIGMMGFRNGNVATAASLSAKARDKTLERKPLGSHLPTNSKLVERKISLGKGMFVTNWMADTGVKFNNRNCMNCHDQPVAGGANRRSPKDVLMVPDANHEGGWSNSRRFLQLRADMKDGSYQVLDIPNDAVVRKSPAMFGIGLIDGIPTKDILANSDPIDKDQDGISGRMPLLANGKYGRFGWKSTFGSLNDFVIDAYEIEVGVQAYDPKTHPIGTIDGNQIEATDWFLRMLAPPSQAPNIEEMKAGRKLFSDLNCMSCHTPTWKTAKHSEAALSEKVIHPYSNFLLHQMGNGKLHETQGPIAKREFRTPPLWGIGQVGGKFLHDKSANTLEEAILKGHGGEASASRKAFAALSLPEKIALFDFLNAL